MASVEEEDWRAGRSLLDRFKYMFDTKYGSDVEFMVGGDKKLVRAHRVFLVGGSSVLDRMLTYKCDDDRPITVDDVEPGVFDEMLRYLYYDSVNIDAVNVTGLLHVADKYLIPGLGEKCSTFLQTQLNLQNVCKLLDQSLKYRATSLEIQCLGLMSENARAVMQSPDFLTLSNKALEKLIKSDTLAVSSEREVYEACVRWADERCRAEKKVVNDVNRRAALGPVLYQIRFPTMSAREFAELTVNSTLLTPTERMSISDRIALGTDFENMSVSGSDKFIFKKRNGKLLVQSQPRHVGHQQIRATSAVNARPISGQQAGSAPGMGGAQMGRPTGQATIPGGPAARPPTYKYSPNVRNTQLAGSRGPAVFQPVQPVRIQGQEPLTSTMLAAVPPQEQKQMLGERLFPLIRAMHETLAGKITGMLLDMDNSELLYMLQSPESLKAKVEEAVTVLFQAHQAKEGTKPW